MRAAAVLLVIAACARPTGQGEHAIIGGALDPGDPAVASVELAGAPCSGVLIRPDLVVTAAHCAAAGGAGTVSFGAGQGAFTETIAIDHVWRSRYWTPGDDAHDLAVLQLAHDAAAAPVDTRFTTSIDGLTLRVVGFGRTVAGDPASAGQKRQVTLRGAGETLAADPSAGTCTGDSGGAVLAAQPGGGEALVAIVTAGPPDCAGPTSVTRLAAVPHLVQVIDDFDACWGTGMCAACSFDGTCTPDCVEVDLDCPLGAASGVDCAAATTCESRVCTTAPDDPRVRYCSATCAHDADCPPLLGRCDTGRCVFPGGTPGILGAPCDAAADCRSAICDTRQHVCAVPCADGDACPDGFACGPIPGGRACTLPDRGCSAGGAPGPLVALALLLVRRRRRTAGCAGARAGRARPAPAPPDPDRR